MSTNFIVKLAKPLWTIERIVPREKMRDAEFNFLVSVETGLTDLETNPDLQAVIKMVEKANKLHNKRIKDKRNRFITETTIVDERTIMVTLNTTFNSKELFQIINTK